MNVSNSNLISKISGFISPFDQKLWTNEFNDDKYMNFEGFCISDINCSQKISYYEQNAQNHDEEFKFQLSNRDNIDYKDITTASNSEESELTCCKIIKNNNHNKNNNNDNNFNNNYYDKTINFSNNYVSNIESAKAEEASQYSVVSKSINFFRGGFLPLKKGRWTVEEDEKLLKLRNEMKISSWKEIASYFDSKNNKQCMYRYRKIFIKKSILKWTNEEDDLLLSLVNKYGEDFNTFLEQFPNKKEKDLIHRYYKKINPASLVFTPMEDELILQLYNNRELNSNEDCSNTNNSKFTIKESVLNKIKSDYDSVKLNLLKNKSMSAISKRLEYLLKTRGEELDKSFDMASFLCYYESDNKSDNLMIYKSSTQAMTYENENKHDNTNLNLNLKYNNNANNLNVDKDKTSKEEIIFKSTNNNSNSSNSNNIPHSNSNTNNNISYNSNISNNNDNINKNKNEYSNQTKDTTLNNLNNKILENQDLTTKFDDFEKNFNEIFSNFNNIDDKYNLNLADTTKPHKICFMNTHEEEDLNDLNFNISNNQDDNPFYKDTRNPKTSEYSNNNNINNNTHHINNINDNLIINNPPSHIFNIKYLKGLKQNNSPLISKHDINELENISDIAKTNSQPSNLNINYDIATNLNLNHNLNNTMNTNTNNSNFNFQQQNILNPKNIGILIEKKEALEGILSKISEISSIFCTGIDNKINSTMNGDKRTTFYAILNQLSELESQFKLKYSQSKNAFILLFSKYSTNLHLKMNTIIQNCEMNQNLGDKYKNLMMKTENEYLNEQRIHKELLIQIDFLIKMIRLTKLKINMFRNVYNN